jgi:hypothetical protein
LATDGEVALKNKPKGKKKKCLLWELNLEPLIQSPELCPLGYSHFTEYGCLKGLLF